MSKQYEDDMEQYPMLSSAQARALLPKLSEEDIRSYRERTHRAITEDPEFERLYVKVLYLCNLCALGDFDAIQKFLRETNPKTVHEIVNGTPYEQNHGNSLHAVLYWNTGTKAIELVTLLLGYGADFLHDYHDQFPWEQSGNLWIPCVILDKNKPFLGRRNEKEFEPTMNYVRQKLFSYAPNQPTQPERPAAPAAAAAAPVAVAAKAADDETPDTEGWTTVSNKNKNKNKKKMCWNK